MPRKELPKNYYYYVKVTYKDGKVHSYRFTNQTHKKSAIASLEKDSNVSYIEEKEGYDED